MRGWVVGTWLLGAAIASGCGGNKGQGTGGGTGSSSTGGGPTSGASSTSVGSTAGTSVGSTASATAGGSTSTGGGGSGSSGGGSTGGPPTACNDDCHYVRAGASGGGTDWNDALPALPADLQRGHVYFVAAGTYPPYMFDDPESGDDTIVVLRATVADHGTDVGWDPGYADGEAVTGELQFQTGYYEVDGRHASRAVGGFQSTVVDIAAPAVTFRGFDVDGNFQEQNGIHVDGACTGMNIGADDALVAGNRIHDAADDGVSMGGAGISFSGNVVHALHGCGTDGGCGPCYNGHSDGLELYHLTDSEIVGNLIYDVASTSTVFFGNWADELGNGPADYCDGVLLANNLLYSPDTGFVAYIEDSRNVQVYQNVLWGLHQGAYGGLSIGIDVTGLDVYNNVILSINYTHIGGTYDPVEHRGDYNLFGYSLGQWGDGPNSIVAVDPGFWGINGGEGPAVADPTPDAFAPAAGSPMLDAGYAGDANVVIPPTDFFGNPRDDTPNIGAIE